MPDTANPPQDFDDYQNAINHVIRQFPGRFAVPRVELVSPFPDSGAFDIMIVVQAEEDDEDSERDQIRDQVQPVFANHGILLPEPQERADGNYEDEAEYFFELKAGENPENPPFA